MRSFRQLTKGMKAVMAVFQNVHHWTWCTFVFILHSIYAATTGINFQLKGPLNDLFVIVKWIDKQIASIQAGFSRLNRVNIKSAKMTHFSTVYMCVQINVE